MSWPLRGKGSRRSINDAQRQQDPRRIDDIRWQLQSPNSLIASWIIQILDSDGFDPAGIHTPLSGTVSGAAGAALWDDIRLTDGVTAVPEPGTFRLIGWSLLALGMAKRRA